MGISNSEHITRIGLFYSRAKREKAKMLLNIEHVIVINLYVSINIEVDWDDGPGFDSISPDNINKMKVYIRSKYIIQAK
jgi:hypothetical protein